MKTSELHSLIGRPSFNIGDYVKIKDTKQVGWVSHICVTHGIYKDYWYMVVNEDEEYIRGNRQHAGFLAEDIELMEDDLDWLAEQLLAE